MIEPVATSHITPHISLRKIIPDRCFVFRGTAVAVDDDFSMPDNPRCGLGVLLVMLLMSILVLSFGCDMLNRSLLNHLMGIGLSSRGLRLLVFMLDSADVLEERIHFIVF